MTREEQIMKLQTYKMFEGEDTVYVDRDDVLKILEQNSCEDAISRQALYEWLDGWKEKNRYYHPHTKNEIIPICEVIDIIQSLPSVTPKADDVIDKIRAEIMDFEEELFHRPNTDYSDYAAVRHCVEIIDKYKAEADDPDINDGNIESEVEE